MEAQLAGAERDVERALSGLERELNGARNVADELIGRFNKKDVGKLGVM